MQLYIKNMVCDRCIMAVRRELDNQGLDYKNVQLGEVELTQGPSKAQLEKLSERLTAIGF
jgi:AraC family transcriptional regulator